MVRPRTERRQAVFHADTPRQSTLRCHGMLEGNDSFCGASPGLLRRCAHLESPKQETTWSAVRRQKPTHFPPVQRTASSSERILSFCAASSSGCGLLLGGGSPAVAPWNHFSNRIIVVPSLQLRCPRSLHIAKIDKRQHTTRGSCRVVAKRLTSLTDCVVTSDLSRHKGS